MKNLIQKIMKKGISLVILLVILLLFSGCWPRKTIMTAANITQPVLVGNVKTIGGNPIDNSDLQAVKPFSAKLENSSYVYAAVYFYGYQTLTEGSNLIDKQLLPIADDPSTLIIVDQIRFNVVGGYWLFVLYYANKGWIEGTKYKYISNEHK